MQFITVLTIAGLLGAPGAAGAQEPPPTPPVQSSAPQTTGAPPAQSPTQVPPPTVPSTTAEAPPAPVVPSRPFTPEELRLRRGQIYLMEGVLMNAVKLAAQNTASEIRRIEPNIVMFSSSPVRAHGTHLEGYGVLFQVEIPSVIPSVASLVETVQRQRARPNPAQTTALTSASASDASMDPDAHYVESVKHELVNAMVRLSNSMELRPDEWLAVEARDGTEAPGQLSQPSTMMLRIKGSDLADYFAGRITIEEARKRVQVSGF